MKITTPALKTNPKLKQRRLQYLSWGLLVIGGVYFSFILVSLVTKKSSNDLNTVVIYRPNNVARHRVKRDTNQVSPTGNTSTVKFNSTATPEMVTNSGPKGIYPEDVFDLEARQNGAVVLHVIGMLYMFIALAIVCDEFFVPALEVIIFRLSISDDVAGATFMAAGGSAPELFTSIIGVFLAKSNVGVGTIVGSAVFNILFVIGMCSILSHQVLKLTWWPLFRDCVFYIISLLILIVSFSDAKIEFFESIVLIVMYLLYVTFMKFNQTIEKWVKSKIASLKASSSSDSKVSPTVTKISPGVRALVQSISNPTHEQHPKNTFSYGIVQLIMHSLDPANEETTQEDSSSALYAIARAKLISPRVARSLSARVVSQNKIPPRNGQYSQSDRVKRPTTPTAVVYENEGVKVVPQTENSLQFSNASVTSPITNGKSVALTTIEEESNRLNEVTDTSNGNKTILEDAQQERVSPPSEIEPSDKMGDALDMSFPKSNAKRVVYLVLFPLTFLLWLTLPDVRNPKKEKWFMATFFGCIIWIAIFSYLMVWMAHQIGETIEISEAVMGLTFLAAGTSVPDLITSVIVARKGLGDMAVSSSVGSNIFDVTIGLPFPWLIKSLIFLGQPVTVESGGLFCSVLLLFAMLLFVVISIAVCKWKMTKKLGFIMLALYGAFLVLSLLLELNYIACPFT